MIPNPLHPAVVHFPIVLAVFLPLIAAVVLWRIHDGARVRSWAYVALTAALLVVSGLVAKKTGEDQEDRVEAVVPEAALHDHEEAAETFLLVGWVVLGTALVGFAPGMVGKGGRLIAVAGTLALLWFGWRVGDLGGKLVYQHGAAAAYTTATAAPADASGVRRSGPDAAVTGAPAVPENDGDDGDQD
jgi:hypothetical protein